LGGLVRLGDIFTVSQAIGKKLGGNGLPAAPSGLVWPVNTR
jgi:hypothetical protein